MNLTQIKQAIRMLSLEQLRRLEEWIHDLIIKAEASASQEASSGRKVVEERTVENITYQLEGIRCGKESCKCTRGEPHGPYWYSYIRTEGRVKSQYVGKNLPPAVEKALKKGKSPDKRLR